VLCEIRTHAVLATLAVLVASCTRHESDSDPIPPDEDSDGFTAGIDCDDHDGDVHPGAVELCNAVDDDCDGTADEDASDSIAFWSDVDGDSYGSATPVVACELPSGAADRSGDCDDANADVRPDSDESCNAVDDDCDGEIDEDPVDAGSLYEDQDGDGYGGLETPAGCPGAGRVTSPGDCDDGDEAVHPAAKEICRNGIDDDCDPATDCRMSGDYVDPEALADATLHWSGTGASAAWGAWAGDIDGDGFDDAVVGATWPAPGVVVWWGGAAPGVGAALDVDAGAPSVVVDGGDVDGDGFSDVLAADGSAAVVAWGGPIRASSGSLASSGGSWSAAGARDVAFVGDADGDGFGDWLASDVTDATGGPGAGAVRLVYGDAIRPASGSLSAIAAASLVGDPGDAIGTLGTSSGGDFDGDGLDDLLICGPVDVDAAGTGIWGLYVIYGSPTRLAGSRAPSDADAALTAGGYYGVYTACDGKALGDLDGDGHVEVALALGAGPARAWIWSSAGTRWRGGVDTSSSVAEVTGAPRDMEMRVTSGDLDADGFDDLAVAVPFGGTTSNVAAFYGDASFAGALDIERDFDARILGTSSYGVAVALDASGDGNADGYADLLGVTPWELGHAWLFFGAGW
jgi:hypothetical protein